MEAQSTTEQALAFLPSAASTSRAISVRSGAYPLRPYRRPRRRCPALTPGVQVG